MKFFITDDFLPSIFKLNLSFNILKHAKLLRVETNWSAMTASQKFLLISQFDLSTHQLNTQITRSSHHDGTLFTFSIVCFVWNDDERGHAVLHLPRTFLLQLLVHLVVSFPRETTNCFAKTATTSMWHETEPPIKPHPLKFFVSTAPTHGCKNDTKVCVQSLCELAS